ncbi:MAG: YHS domain-containing protein [Nitrospinae bacterium]|nr:YHS domain-containing protein [Nitrospinota bacterium]
MISSLVKQNQGYLCPTCGCSLVRLGIDPLTAPSTDYQGQEYRFCCEGCVTPFLENPQFYLEEIKDMVICPTCLGEKTRGQALCVNINGESVYFCRCPCCIDDFKKSPESLERLCQKRPKS